MDSLMSYFMTAFTAVISGIVLFLLQRFFSNQQTKEEARDLEKAKDICYDRYYQYLQSLDAESLLEENFQFVEENDSVTLTVKISLIEDIALSKPFGFKELNGEQ